MARSVTVHHGHVIVCQKIFWRGRGRIKVPPSDPKLVKWVGLTKRKGTPICVPWHHPWLTFSKFVQVQANALHFCTILFFVHIALDGLHIDTHYPPSSASSQHSFQDGHRVLHYGLRGSYFHYNISHHFVCGSDLLDTSDEI